MEQNMQLWLVPRLTQPSLTLMPGESRSASFTESLDGKFSYEIWILADSAEDPFLGIEVDGSELYQNVRIPSMKKGKWYLLGGVTLPKGEHQLKYRNTGNAPIQLNGLLMTRDASYIHQGTADSHRQLLEQGHPVDSMLEQLYTVSGVESPEEKAARLAHLANMGFLEREDQYTAEGNCRCGVPMGGIGAGKIELDEDGILTAITINNNQDVPIYRADGSFFAAWWKKEGENPQCCLLQKGGKLPDCIPRVENIRFDGFFPCAALEYEGLPFGLTLNAFSPLVPYDTKNSAIPGVMYCFRVKNFSDEPMEVSLLFSWENILGTGGSMSLRSGDLSHATPDIFNTWNPGYTWCNRTGNTQSFWAENQRQGIHFTASEDHGNPSSFGEYTLLSPGSLEEVSFCENWDSHTDPLKFWKGFAAAGQLSGSHSHMPAANPEDHPSAGISRKIRLLPGEQREILFILSWHLPHYLDVSRKDIGVFYARNFADSRQSAFYLAENRESLERATREFEKLMRASSLPAWLQHKIINDRFPIYTNSWFTESGKFSINEAPTGMMGCLGTMDQRLACNSLYTNFFPQLDRIELNLFAEQQGEDGSIPHDVGFGQFNEGPHNGTWSDLCSSFILQVYKSFRYTGDQDFLNEMYPRIQRAVEYQLSIDYDRNGIPDVGAGNGTTYDTYHWYGTCSFVASLWLAELQACIRLAQHQQDEAFAQKCRKLFEIAQESMIQELWREFPYGAHFINYHDSLGENISNNCFIAQLAGQWFADLMDLGDLLPTDKISTALRTIWNRNICFRDFKLMSDETTPEGDACGYHYTFIQYDEAYYGCLAITRGMVAEGLECFRRVWEVSHNAPWNIGLTYQTDGFFTGLPYYMTNPASLFLLDALAGWLPDASNRCLQIRLADPDQPLEMPLFSPKIWVWLSYQTEKGIQLRIEKILDDAVFDRVYLKDSRQFCLSEGTKGHLESTPEKTVFHADKPFCEGSCISFSFFN